ncbi:hypothetical protein PQX77_012221 [Marasmius sp. AFHP31]|nr:hypothetical protein PQX77_012221 [Marasmius sp. AFHP31]
MPLRPPLFFILSLLALERTQCFLIEGIPDQVTTGQTAALTWFRGTNDPTNFGLAKTSADGGFGPIDPTVSVTPSQLQGVLTATFTKIGTLSIAAHDLQKEDIYGPSPFYIANQAIVVAAGSSLTAPGNSPNVNPTVQATQTTSNPTSPTSGDKTSSLTRGEIPPANTNRSLSLTSATSDVSQRPSSPPTTTVQTRPGTSGKDSREGSPRTLISNDLQPTSSLPIPVTTKGVNPGIIAGIVLGIISTLCLMAAGWIVGKRRKRSASTQEGLGASNVQPYPGPDTIEVAEKHPYHAKNSPITSTCSNDPPTFGQSNEPTEAQEHETIAGTSSPPPATMNGNATAECRMSEPSREPIFHHTDSGWRLAFERFASQPSEAGRGSVFEMPPSYSEAG